MDGMVKPARKSTRFITTSVEVAKCLSHQCDGSHPHIHLVQKAQEYPRGLCEAIYSGICEQMKAKKLI